MGSRWGMVLALAMGCSSNEATLTPASSSPSSAESLMFRAQRLADELVAIARMAVDLNQLEGTAAAGGLGIQVFQPVGEPEELAGDLGLVRRKQTFAEAGGLTRDGLVEISRLDEQVVRREVRLLVRKGDQALRDAVRVQELGSSQHEFIKTTYHFAWQDEGYRNAVATSRREGQDWNHTGSLDRASEVGIAIRVESLDDGGVLARGTETPMFVTVKVDANRQVTSLRLDPSTLLDGELVTPPDE